VLDKTSKLFQKVIFWQEILKWAEVFFTISFFIALFWSFYLSLCSADSCSSFLISNSTQNTIITLFFSVWGLLNSLRIGLVFLLNDDDERVENLFYISLVGLFLCNLIIGLFFTEFVARTEKNQVDTPSFIALIIVLMSTVASLLADKQTWDKSTPFVKYRISLTILELVILLVNPFLGIFSAIIVLPISIMLKGGIEKKEAESFATEE